MGDAVAEPSETRVTQLFHLSWEYGDQRRFAPLNGLSGEREETVRTEGCK